MSGQVRGRPPGPVLLATKFLPPVPRPGYVRRERLHRRLAEAPSTPITLLSAPAGFGKTTLLAGWLSELEVPWAWLTIDGRDNDPGRLWPHLIAALQRLAGPVGDGALVELRRRGGRGPADNWLTQLINDLATTSARESCLVLDDLHLLTDADLRSAIGVLAENLPEWLHLVLSTRADPPLPLPRLRTDGRITEVREIDLRFVTGEADSLLAAWGMTALDAGQIEVLVERTEGWAAGLQLAAIMLDHAADTHVEDIVGSLRPFTDYLITEVVDHQPIRMRDFLYATSVVDQLNPALATALSGDLDADQLLRQAEQQGLFLVALNGRDEWYRYHHLFAEALRHELRVRYPQAADDANRAAARWFEDHGDAATALEHWLAAGRPDEALRLVVDVGFALGDRGQTITIERIARRIPPSVPGDDPARQLDYAMLYYLFEPETFLAWVGQAAATLARLEDPDHDLVTRYLVVQSLADHCVGAWDDAFDHATEAVGRGRARGGPVGYSERSGLQVIRAAGWLERVDEAEAGFRAYLDDPRMPEALRVMVAPSAWALAAAIGGRIDDADHWASNAAAASERGFHNVTSAQELLLTQAMVARERGDGDAAVESIETLRATALQPCLSLRAVAEIELALARLDQGRFDEAATTLDATQQVRPDGPLGLLVVARVNAARSAVAVAAGDLVGAQRAAERMPPGLWREVALARSLLAGGASVEAEEALRPLSPTTPRQHAVVNMLRALSLADRNPDAAHGHTVTALQAAAAVGMQQTVITAGAGVTELIEKASWAVPARWIERARNALAHSAHGPAVGRLDRLVEQLTAREREAVRYLPSRLNVPEIARELGVSPNTLKTHLKSVYRKLGVTSRDEAVTVARDLGILR